MNDDNKATHVIAAFLTLATTLIPGVDDAIHAVGGQDAVVGTVVATYTMVYGLVHYFRTNG